MVRCDKCGQEFSRRDVLVRHQKTGACVMAQAVKVTHSLPPPPPPPPHSNSLIPPPPVLPAVVEQIPGLGGLVRRSDGVWDDALAIRPASAAGLSWKKYAVIGGIGLVIIAGIWMMTRPRVRYAHVAESAAAGPLPIKMPGGMENFIPPALFSLVAMVFLSKMVRTEFGGWTKVFKDWAK